MDHVGYADQMVNPVDLNQFLASVEKRAYSMAMVSVRNVDDALDIVQDAMFTLARKYGSKPSNEWAPLFYRVLNNRVMDFHRANSRRAGLFSRFVFTDGQPQDDIEQIAGSPRDNPEFSQELDASTARLFESLAQLPARQQQAFMLRAWEGMDVKNTAKAMNCSTGSVKTHYSRAVHTLRDKLREELQDYDDG
ncbi:MAG: RNA polymerase sigma factor [Pseudomonadales bacterium]|jgi:RNA polymerase sigma-70 factor (ECF subfamily)|nr:RNA polymerase sigma factor [Pseudomonadales bacterium]